MYDIKYRTRDAAADPEGALVLFHGRGADENDLFPLFDILDPDRKLAGIAPRGPLSLPPGGAHWYVVREVGYPNPETFWPTFESAASWLDALPETTGVPLARTVLGGFSQGAVMSYALGLANGRTRPAALMPLSGFMPEVDGLEYDLAGIEGYPVAIGHGTYDPVISVDFSRRAAARLSDAGADVMFRESPMMHSIDPEYLPELREWLGAQLLE